VEGRLQYAYPAFLLDLPKGVLGGGLSDLLPPVLVSLSRYISVSFNERLPRYSGSPFTQEEFSVRLGYGLVYHLFM